MLNLFPEWQPRLQEVANAYPEWQPLIDSWDEMTRLWERDYSTGECQELYSLMKKLRGY